MEGSTSNIECEGLLSKAECLEIVKNDLNLKDTNQIQLNLYKLVKCSPDLLGFMGEYYKLEVVIQEKNCDDIKSLSYFVKSLPLTNAIYRAELEGKRVIEKESAIYAEILPNIRRYCTTDLFPKSFLSRRDLMVLEDYDNPAKSLRQMRDDESYTTKHHKIFIHQLAKFHAASLAWTLKDRVNSGYNFEDILFELQLTTSNVWYTTGIKSTLHLAQNHPQYKYREAQEFIKQKLYNILWNMEDYTKPSDTQHNVLCHRDSWDRNIFWQYSPNTNEPISCRIVDFQLMSYTPPAIDVLIYLCNYIPESQNREQFLCLYYDSLKFELKSLNLPEDLITREEFEADCKRALLPVLVNRSLCEPLMKLPKGWSQAMRETEPETYDYYMHCDRREMYERVSQTDETYMETILYPVQKIMEYFGFMPNL